RDWSSDVCSSDLVAQGLGHLFAVHPHGAGMHPGHGVGLAGSGFALGNLVFVVREYQIRTTTMDIESVAQTAGGHYRTFDMPAGTTLTPGRSPAGLTRLGRLPQHEVQRIFLGFTHLDARAYLQILDALARQLAVTGKSPHPAIDVTIAPCVGVTLVDQGLDHAEHAVDMFAGPRLLIRTQHAQAALGLMHGGDHALGQLLEAFAIFGSTADDLVVDVGDVAYVGQGVTTVAQPA